MQIKCCMLKESTTVDIERLSQTIHYLHAREKNVKGSTQRKAFDLLKRNFKLREFFKQLKSNLTRLESNIPFISTREQFKSWKRKFRDLQTESLLYQEMRFRLGKSQLNCI